MRVIKVNNRQQELVWEIADYLTDWTSDESSVLEFDESIKLIESYGVGFDEPCDQLVINAVRHFDDTINFWNKSAIPEALEVVGFTKEEIERYNTITESVIRIQFG